MKKLYISVIFLTLILLTPGCEKVKDPAGQRNIGVVPTISDISGIFISGEPSSFISFKVDLLSGMSVESAEIVVSKQDNVEKVKIADLTSFPSTFSFTLGDVAEKLGTVNDGDLIYIEVVTTSNGIRTRSPAALSGIVYCKYNASMADGSYHSVSSEWNTEGDISITGDPADPYKVYVKGLEAIEGLNEDLGPLLMQVNPVTFEVVADKTILASDAWGDSNMAYEGTGMYNSCSGEYSMSFHISTDQTDYGTFSFTFTRK